MPAVEPNASTGRLVAVSGHAYLLHCCGTAARSRTGFGPDAFRQARIDKVKPTSYYARSAAPGGTRPGGVAERLKAADCKSADVRLRRFESYPLHQRPGGRGGIEGLVQGLERPFKRV